jgi:hypothetical protein
MSNLVARQAAARPATLVELAPIASRHTALLKEWAGPYAAFKILTAETCDLIETELRTALAARPEPSFANQMAGRLAAAYPARAAERDADTTLWLALLIEELEQKPAWAIAEAVPGVWRSARWRPSIADVVQAINAETDAVLAMLRGLHKLRRANAEIAARGEGRKGGAQ